MIWSYLVHVSYNMWNDREVPPPSVPRLTAKPYLRFDDDFWAELIPAMCNAGVNLVILDLGDGVRYESHPEIAVQNAWTTERLREEIQRLREAGLEPIPKLNFSATHDVWLGPYARKVSTPEYYDVCRDLIKEVVELFDTPQFFHLGMDEETAEHQRFCEYVVVRQYDLWWHDCLYLVDQVKKNGSRAWVWSDYCWKHPDEYLSRMPLDVLQSNWWYDAAIDPELVEVKTYQRLAEAGYEQVPTTSNYSNQTNLMATLEYIRNNVSLEKIAGFMHTVWKPTQWEYKQDHLEALAQLAEGRKAWEKFTACS